MYGATLHRSVLCTAVLAAALLAVCSDGHAQTFVSSVIASGLNNPRGLTFGPDGALYVAEAGTTGGSGPSTLIRGVPNIYTETGSITRIFNGTAMRVVTGLPSIYAATTGETVGANDVSFGAGGTRYITIGAGVDPTVRSTDLAPSGIKLGRLESTGRSVDVSAFEATTNPAGGPLDSNPWRSVPIADGVLVTDAGANALLKVGNNGVVSLVTTFASLAVGGPGPTDPVPTGLAIGPDGAYYVGMLTGFPFAPGSSQVFRVTADGASSVFASGFTNVTDIAFGGDGSLYVLEYDANGLLAPGDAGALIRVASNGVQTTIFSNGLVAPTGLEIGANGSFYVSNHGNLSGGGEVLQISLIPEPSTYALMLGGLGVVGRMARWKPRSVRGSSAKRNG